MSEEAILQRLAAVENQLAEIMPALERHPYRHYPASWIRDRIENRATERRGGRTEHFDLHIAGEIDEQLANRVLDELHDHCLATTVNVHIDSKGGDYNAALRIHRAILWHAAPSKVAMLGKSCMSAGMIVALAADRRIASPDTTLLFHGVGDRPDHSEHWSVARHLIEIRRLREIDVEMLNIVADRTGADLAALAAEASNEDYMELDRGLQLGFIHEVVPA